MRIIDGEGKHLRKLELHLTGDEAQDLIEAVLEWPAPPYEVHAKFGMDAGWRASISTNSDSELVFVIPTA